MQVDNVERRESTPRLSSQQQDDALDAERQAQFDQAYEHHINAACAAIQKTPYSLVTATFIGQVLDTLACKAQEARMPEVCELIEILSCEVTP